MSRQRKRRSSRPVRPLAWETTVGQPEPIWADVGGRRIFVVGWTSGGAPNGVFEDEMDAGMNDIDADGSDEPF